MSDVSHATCAGCSNTVQPVRWERFHRETVFPDGEMKIFDGMTAICRRCNFTIAELGFPSESRWKS